MPYVITTKRPLMDPPLRSDGFEIVSRRAVVTLEEARTYVTEIGLRPALLAEDYDDLRQQFAGVRDSGGTVGPLPDGTLIEVEHWRWAALTDAAEMPDVASDAEIIAAYNARHTGVHA